MENCIKIKLNNKNYFVNIPYQDFLIFANIFNLKLENSKNFKQNIISINKFIKIFIFGKKYNENKKYNEFICNYIEEQLKSGYKVSLNSIFEKFKYLNISKSCICNYFTKTRKKLELNGLKIVKTGKGIYQLPV